MRNFEGGAGVCRAASELSGRAASGEHYNGHRMLGYLSTRRGRVRACERARTPFEKGSMSGRVQRAQTRYRTPSHCVPIRTQLHCTYIIYMCAVNVSMCGPDIVFNLLYGSLARSHTHARTQFIANALCAPVCQRGSSTWSPSSPSSPSSPPPRRYDGRELKVHARVGVGRPGPLASA